MIRRALSLSLLVGALLPATADASGDLWATVNVCDTSRHANTIGIRASMPGQPRPARLWMRYRVQYDAGGSWRYVKDADSGWRSAGRARPRPAESGWSFEFEPPSGPVTFRGVVRFQWRRAGTVVRRAMRVTERGHRSTAGADPPGYSAATCSMA